MALVSVKYQRKKGHHQPFFTVRMSVMPHTPASAPVVKSQVTDSSSSNVDVKFSAAGCSTTLARPQGTGTCTRPRMAIPSVGKMSENVSQGFWNPPVQLA
ncbi:uncharacterized protein LOC144162405 isoform X3 [Haemaphysalis longicornis]